MQDEKSASVGLDPLASALTVVVAVRVVDAEHLDFVQDTAGVTERHLGHPGFLGAGWLIRRPDGPGGDTPGGSRRAVELIRWADAHDHRRPDPAVTADRRANDGRWEVYDLDTVISADGRDRAVVSLGGPITGVMFLDPVAGRREWVNDFNKSETRDFIRHLPGFVSASFLLSRTSDRIVEYVQWRSFEDLIAAMGVERFREHVQVVEQNGAADFGLYDVHTVVTPAYTADVVGP